MRIELLYPILQLWRQKVLRVFFNFRNQFATPLVTHLIAKQPLPLTFLLFQCLRVIQNYFMLFVPIYTLKNICICSLIDLLIYPIICYLTILLCKQNTKKKIDHKASIFRTMLCAAFFTYLRSFCTDLTRSRSLHASSDLCCVLLPLYTCFLCLLILRVQDLDTLSLAGMINIHLKS